ncbi:MAG: CHAP domain-containing protein [Deltaproteobacteria bacterium]|nr:CHAP domain-containing protein [Deltaproteobacteria bacterium]
MRLRRWLCVFGAFWLAVVMTRPCAAANICDETVPSTHILDGFPAYAQCTASSGSAVYSNNGIDTATSSGGADWVRTQGSGGYQCTEWARRYLRFKWNVASTPNGNAGTWCDGAIPSGLVKTTAPVHGDVVVFAPGSCGADATTGHVAVVDVVNANDSVTFVEQNRANRRSCAISTAACFLHATANGGTSLDGGTPDSALPDAWPDTPSDASPRGDASADRRTSVFGTGGATGTGGVVASGGRVGTDGAAGAGGQAESGGSSGAGGAVGGGGAVGSGGGGGEASTTTDAPAGGSGGTSSGGTNESTASPSSGCACRLAARNVADDRAPGRTLLLVLALAWGLAVSSQRRRTIRASRNKPRLVSPGRDHGRRPPEK